MKINQLQKKISNRWGQIYVGNIFKFIKNYSFSRDNLSNGMLSGNKIGCIHYGDLHATFTTPSIDLSKVEIPLIKDTNFKPKKEELLKDGDLIMADASEDYNGIGVTVSIHGLGKNKVVGGLHTFVLRDEKNLTNEYYRQYIFRNPKIRNTLQKVANGVSVYGISKTAVSKLILSIPPFPEQSRIVSVLETWDKTIEKLEKKIEIKKQIKKGLMQYLLTGKKRLKGFSNKWEIKKLEDIIFKKKKTNRQSGHSLDSGKYPFFNNSSRSFAQFFNEYDFDGEMIIANTGGVAYFDYYFGKFAATADCFVFSSKEETKFLFYTLKSLENEINRLGFTGSGIKHLDKKYFLKLKIEIPSIKEQKSIANIITTADQEITELKKKLQIIKDQKKYLLNNLITGKIRTPETLSTNK